MSKKSPAFVSFSKVLALAFFLAPGLLKAQSINWSLANGYTVASGAAYTLTASTGGYPAPTVYLYKNGSLVATGAYAAVAANQVDTGPATKYFTATATNGASGACTINIAAPVDTQAPSTPTNLNGSSITSSSFTLTWTASTDNVGVTAYEVKRGSTSLGTVTGTSKSVTGLSPTETYTMYVRARDAAANWSGWSSGKNVTTTKANQAAVSSSNYTITYGSSFAPSVSGGSGTGNYQWLLAGYLDWPLNGEAGTRSGSNIYTSWTPPTAKNYTLWVRRAGDADYYDAPGVNYTLTVNKANQTGVGGSLSGTTVTYPSTKTVTASGGQSTGAYEFRQNGGTGTVTFSGSGSSRTITPTVAGTAVIQVRKLGDTNYNTSSWVSAGTLTINKANQTGVGGSLGATTVNYPSTTSVTASGGQSSGAYEFRQNGGTGTVTFSGSGSSRTITPTSPGSAVIEVRKLGNSNYNTSSWISAGTLTINKGNQTGVGGSLGATTVTYPSTTSVTASGGQSSGAYEFRQNGGTGTVTFSGSGSSRTITPTVSGTAVIEVRKLSNNYYNTSSWVNAGTLTINKANQAAVSSSNQTITYGNAFAPSSITGGSGTGNYQWLLAGYLDWPLNGEAGTRSGSTIYTSWTPPEAKNYTLWVRRIGDANYNDGGGVSYTLTVNKANQTGVGGSLGSTTVTYPSTTTVTASGGQSSGAYEFRQNGGTGTVSFSGSGSSRTITPTVVGTAVIEVRKLSDTNYNTSSWVSAGTLTVNLASQTGVGGSLVTNPVTYPSTTTVNATGGQSGGAYEFCQNGGTGTVSFSGSGSSRTITPTVAGTAVIQVRKLGDSNYSTSSWVNAGTLTINKASNVITFPSINDHFTDEGPVTLNATASSGLTVSYSVTSGDASVTGNSLTLGSTPGNVTVRATQAGNGGYAAATPVDRTFYLWGPNEDADGDGLANGWEKLYGLDRLNPNDAGQTGSSGLTYQEAYDLWRSPNGSSSYYDNNPTQMPLVITVHGKGTGSVYLEVKDENNTLIEGNTFNFQPPTGNVWWAEQDNEIRMWRGLGETFKVKVVSATVTDYMVNVKLDSLASPKLQGVVELDDSYINTILKSEISGGEFDARVIPGGVIPFAKMDTSRLEVARVLSFGLGSSNSGRTPGRIIYSSAARVFSDNKFDFEIIEGPAMEWSHKTPTKFQGRVPSGYVEVERTRSQNTVRYYPLGSYPDGSGFNDFSAATPLAVYTLDLTYDGAPAVMSKPDGIKITQSAGGVTLIFEEESEWDEVLTFAENADPNDPEYNSEEPVIHEYNLTNTSLQWRWREPAATKTGLKKVVTTVTRQDFQPYAGGPVSELFGAATVKTTLYNGDSDTDPVASYRQDTYPAGDKLLQFKTKEYRGVSGEKGRGKWRVVDSSIYTTDPVAVFDELGGGAYTEYYSLPESLLNNSPNLDGEPVTALGQPKQVWHTFGDTPGASDDGFLTPSSSNPTTTYSYWPEPVDGRSVPAATETKKGSTVIGQTSFSYSTSSFDTTQTSVTTTATTYTSASDTLTTETRTYSHRTTDPDRRGRPISVIRPDDTQTSYAYQRGTLNSSGVWSASASGPHFLIAELSGKKGTGSAVTHYNPVANNTSTGTGTIVIDDLDLDPNRSTVSQTIVDDEGRMLREATYVYTSSGAFSLLSAAYHQYDDHGNRDLTTDQPNGAGRVLFEADYDGFRKTWERDATGIKLSYTYDDYGRVESITRDGVVDGTNPHYSVPSLVTTYAYDITTGLVNGHGTIVRETVSSPGESETLVTETATDTGGRVVKTTAPGGFVSTTAYTFDSNENFRLTSTTATAPGGGTTIAASYRDGRKKSVTGTAVADVANTYAYDTAGYLTATETLSTGAWTETVTDWAGRVDRVVSPTWDGGADREVINIYNTKGQLLSQDTMSGSTKLLPSRLFAYDSYGRLEYEAVDSDDDDALETATDMDVRRHFSQFVFGQYGAVSQSQWYLYQTEEIWPYDQDDEGGATDRSNVSRYASESYTQISGLTYSVASHVLSADFDRNWTEAITSVDRTKKLTETEATTTGTTETIREVNSNGLLVESENAQGHVSKQSYDALGRLEAVSDPRIDAADPGNGWTDYTYQTGSHLVASVTAPDGKQTTFTYDSAGRLVAEFDNASKATRYAYDLMGNLTHTWGDVPNPVKYAYNALGQRTEMRTWRSGTWNGASLPSGFSSGGDPTTWAYQSSTGLLTSKTDAQSQSTSFEYDDAARVNRRIDARGWHTWYTYYNQADASYGSFNGLQKKIDYRGVGGSNDTDPAGTPDVIFSYHRSGKVKSVIDGTGTRSFNFYESWTNTSYDAELRNKSGRLQAESFSSFLGGSGVSVDYDYQYSVTDRMNGPLESIQLNGSSTTYDVTYGYDNTLRLGEVGYKSFTPIDYAYVSNANLVDTLTQSTGGGAFDYQRDYDYETYSNRLQTLKHAWNTTSAKAVETRLTYESRGLRETEKTKGANLMSAASGPANGLHVDFTYDDRYQVDVSDKNQLDGAGTWGVGSVISGSGRDYNFDPIGNRTDGSFTANSLNEYTMTGYSYDNNGNLLSDGTRTFAYDGENRLISVSVGGSTYTYKYDYLGRRISKSGTGISETRYIYDGWNLVAELNSSNTVIRKYVWGSDVSGSMQGAGGVGGLVMIEDGSEQYYPVYDASHNVVGLYDSSGNTDAAYEYDPFGNTVGSGGSYASTNPFRYSTKYTDNETGLVYYGKRFYDPQLGRFLNRDPIEETGGLNLYGFAGNNGVNGYDYLGLTPEEDAAEEARKAAEKAARREAIERDGLINFFVFGTGDSYVDWAGEEAYRNNRWATGTLTLSASDPDGNLVASRRIQFEGRYSDVVTGLALGSDAANQTIARYKASLGFVFARSNDDLVYSSESLTKDQLSDVDKMMIVQNNNFWNGDINVDHLAKNGKATSEEQGLVLSLKNEFGGAVFRVNKSGKLFHSRIAMGASTAMNTDWIFDRKNFVYENGSIIPRSEYTIMGFWHSHWTRLAPTEADVNAARYRMIPNYVFRRPDFVDRANPYGEHRVTNIVNSGRRFYDDGSHRLLQWLGVGSQ